VYFYRDCYLRFAVRCSGHCAIRAGITAQLISLVDAKPMDARHACVLWLQFAVRASGPDCKSQCLYDRWCCSQAEPFDLCDLGTFPHLSNNSISKRHHAMHPGTACCH
jgi:hypothetical protein